jgi:hypothetical protein
MRIVALEFVAFGCLSNVRLRFGDGEKQNFHLIYGDNEAGKSTALRGLTNLFYGIPARTSDAFRHKSRDLRIRAELLSSNGARLTIVRRKGQQKTLLGGENQPLPESTLGEMLGGISEEAFTTVYRLDHETLVRGGADLSAGRGDLAESLFQAGGGVTVLHKVLRALEEQAKAIFKPRGRQPLINGAIEKYQQARKQSRELSVRPSDWAKKQVPGPSWRRNWSGVRVSSGGCGPGKSAWNVSSWPGRMRRGSGRSGQNSARLEPWCRCRNRRPGNAPRSNARFGMHRPASRRPDAKPGGWKRKLPGCMRPKR